MNHNSVYKKIHAFTRIPEKKIEEVYLFYDLPVFSPVFFTFILQENEKNTCQILRLVLK